MRDHHVALVSTVLEDLARLGERSRRPSGSPRRRPPTIPASAWLQAWRYHERLQAQPAHVLRAWLATVAEREAWRLNSELRTSTVEDVATTEAPAPERDVAAELSDRMQALELIGRLTPHQRPVVLLWAAGRSYQQIADDLGISLTNVKRTMTKAFDRLRES